MSTPDRSETVSLSNASLARFGGEFALPAYDRSRVKPAIVHFGVGGFHRAHQAVYTDEVLASGDLDWGIRGAGITAGDRRMQQALSPQDYLYSVVARDTEGEERRVVGSIVDYLLAIEDAEPLLSAMSDESTRIISMTITENGYCYRPENIELDLDNPAVADDLRLNGGGGRPSTVYGYLRTTLSRVRERGGRPPTILSCDNLPQNGDRLRRLFLQFLDNVDRDLRAYVEQEVEFPNCMVDRITPITTDDQRRWLESEHGMTDRWPIFCERFRQWVIEDRFPAGRPDWSVAGATFVSDVVPFERMKIRLLNGSHSALGYVSYLLGHRRVDLAMADTDVAAFVRAYMDQIRPTVGTVPGIDLNDYEDSLLARFANPAIADQVLRLAQDGSKKIPNMILEPLSELTHGTGEFGFAAFALAAWIRFLEGSDESGEGIPIDDPQGEALQHAALATRSGDVAAFFAARSLFPPELAGSETLKAAVAGHLAAIRTGGMRAALRSLLASRS